jgi:hypothetical protein
MGDAQYVLVNALKKQLAVVKDRSWSKVVLAAQKVLGPLPVYVRYKDKGVASLYACPARATLGVQRVPELYAVNLRTVAGFGVLVHVAATASPMKLVEAMRARQPATQKNGRAQRRLKGQLIVHGAKLWDAAAVGRPRTMADLDWAVQQHTHSTHGLSGLNCVHVI